LAAQKQIVGGAATHILSLLPQNKEMLCTLRSQLADGKKENKRLKRKLKNSSLPVINEGITKAGEFLFFLKDLIF